MKTALGAIWASLLPEDVHALTHSENARMRKVIADIQTVAPTRTTVLIQGETGTGKGLMARLIHHLSNRKEMPFTAVHCGAIPDTLVESELFGHERGAFTGAIRQRHGRFELARGGTLFLDEIGTITPAAQIKLLQVLQERVFQRVGGEEEIEADVRLIVATNEPLTNLVKDGSFRKDLYYRVNVFTIEVPPLRERMEDLPLMVDLLLKKQNLLYPKAVQGVHPDVMEAFRGYSWPGNIRELENLLERAYILEQTSLLTPGSFPADLLGTSKPFPAVPINTSRCLADVRKEAVEEVEKRYLTDLLTETHGRIAEAAGIAGVTPRMLHRLLTRYGIRKEQFRKRV